MWQPETAAHQPFPGRPGRGAGLRAPLVGGTGFQPVHPHR